MLDRTRGDRKIRDPNLVADAAENSLPPPRVALVQFESMHLRHWTIQQVIQPCGGTFQRTGPLRCLRFREALYGLAMPAAARRSSCRTIQQITPKPARKLPILWI